LSGPDPLSVPAIATRQQQVEGEVQGVPELQKSMDEAALEAEMAYRKAEAKALLGMPATVDGRKLTVAEREARVFSETEGVWELWQSAKIQAEYAKGVGRAALAELSSLQSRLRVAHESDKAHGRLGAG